MPERHRSGSVFHCAASSPPTASCIGLQIDAARNTRAQSNLPRGRAHTRTSIVARQPKLDVVESSMPCRGSSTGISSQRYEGMDSSITMVEASMLSANDVGSRPPSRGGRHPHKLHLHGNLVPGRTGSMLDIATPCSPTSATQVAEGQAAPEGGRVWSWLPKR